MAVGRVNRTVTVTVPPNHAPQPTRFALLSARLSADVSRTWREVMKVFALGGYGAGYDIIMNAAYDGTVLPTIQAAIRTGTHYCDVNGVIEQALQLTSEAEAVGITSIIANGIGPCITNLMGVHMARQLEEVEQLQLGFASIFNWESRRELTPRQWLNRAHRLDLFACL
jgi:hypothetical protein